MKKIKKLLIFNILFLIMFIPSLVGATNLTANKHSVKLVNDCVSKGTCMKLCEYENYYQVSKMNEDLYYSSMYIYYDFKEGIVIEWYGPASTQGEKKYTKKNFKDVFIKEDVKSDFVKKGSCPKYAYIDSDEFNGPNEACLDNDGKYCKSDPGKGFTNFKGTSNIKFNYSDSIASYFLEYAPTFTCEQLLSSDFKFNDKIMLDFKTNYLNGNNIPPFIMENDQYIKGYDILEERFYGEKEKCDNEIKDKMENGQISSSEADKLLNKNEQGLQDALDELEQSKEDLEKGTNDTLNNGEIIKEKCEVIPLEIRKWINNILKFIRYVALALVIALGALDFMKAAGDGEPDAMKKAGQSFMKRMIAVVILFLLPVIVDFILNMVNIYGVDADNIECMKNLNQ